MQGRYLSEELWRPSLCRPPLPGEYEAWLKRAEVEREELRQGRRRAFEARLEAEAREREEALMKSVSKGPTRFTTQAAVNWGKRRKWTLVDRERWDAITRRHHDLQLAVDVLFDDGRPGMVAIQAAGKGERAAHRRKFEEAGGEATAKRRGIRVLYIEFVRGNPTPILIERWA